MRISEVTALDAIQQAKEDATDTEIVERFEIRLNAAKSYIQSYTGLTVEEMDAREDLTMALFMIINGFHDEDAYFIESKNINPSVKFILDLHSVNLL